MEQSAPSAALEAERERERNLVFSSLCCYLPYDKYSGQMSIKRNYLTYFAT